MLLVKKLKRTKKQTAIMKNEIENIEYFGLSEVMWPEISDKQIALKLPAKNRAAKR